MIASKDRLKDILSTPSYFLKEDQMIEKIESELSRIPGVNFWRDIYGNIFAIKGESEYYPLVAAHTDTVHEIGEYSVKEVNMKEGASFKAFRPNGTPYGIGGDNKTGIFVCLELLKTQDTLKAVFFIGEEFGCYGSILADPSFFSDVGYGLEFDAPNYFWVTEICNGVQLFDRSGEFWRICNPIMDAHTDGLIDPMRGNHPYTDMYPLKGFYDFSCLNFSSGYMNMHSPEEYVVISYVFKAVSTAEKLLTALGNVKYQYVSTQLRRDWFVAQKLSVPNIIRFPKKEVA